MCVAHDKKINDWFRSQDALELFIALAIDLDSNFNCGNSRNLDVSTLSATKYTEMFVGLIISRSGSPQTVELVNNCENSGYIGALDRLGTYPIASIGNDRDGGGYLDKTIPEKRLKPVNKILTALGVCNI